MEETLSAEAQMAAAYRNYVDVFNREASAELADLLAYPAVGSGTGYFAVFHGPADFQQMIEATFADFKTKGWTRSEVDSADGAVMSGDGGVLRATFSRYRGDGECYETGSGHYVMRPIGGAWKIVAMITP